ncbi:MAG: type II toxin-antitoxin system Phd/YefM family antitoxin [Anaerolineales bacterium]
MTEISVGVRELKSQLSKYLRQVKAGRTVVITEHGQTVGRIVPVAKSLDERIEAMIQAGLAEWSGKPLPSVKHRPRVRGKKTVAELLIENRE